jgi:hypothetical protein
MRQGTVADSCNPSYEGSEDQEFPSVRPVCFGLHSSGRVKDT